MTGQIVTGEIVTGEIVLGTFAQGTSFFTLFFLKTPCFLSSLMGSRSTPQKIWFPERKEICSSCSDSTEYPRIRPMMEFRI